MFNRNKAFRVISLVMGVLLLAFMGGANPGTGASLPLFQATPDPCGPALALAQHPRVNVRGGPGTSYPVVGESGPDPLPILGRHHAFTWWQVSLADGRVGWIAADFVTVSGYIEGVQLVEAPEVNGYVPDSNAEWSPVGSARCEATPVATAAMPVLLPSQAETQAALGIVEGGSNIWSPPQNLSQSGAAHSPVMVVEPDGDSHVIWQEETASNFLYVRESDGEWSAPLAVELPFGTRRYFPNLGETRPTPLFRPQLVVDAANRLHALWVDDEGLLYYSDVAADNVASYDAWSARQLLADGVVAFDVVADSSARLHVTYLSTRERPGAPAGVYYLVVDGGQVGLPVLLYSSGYFRALTADRANLRIAVGDGASAGQVYVSWDNRPLDTLFVISSADGGQQWGEVTVVEQRRPEDSPEAMPPSNIQVATSGAGALLLWQADHEGAGCRQYYRWSGDGGQTWLEPQLLETLTGCYRQGQLFAGVNGSMLLLAQLDDGAYLLAWDGERWSEPQLQDALTAFVSAETLRTIQFDCYEAAFRDGQLLVVGCSSGGVKDIWFTARAVESTASWFLPQVWSQPEAITATSLPVAALELVATGDGLLHAFFSQRQDPGIYYTRWDGTAWSRVTLVLKVPEGESTWPVVAAGPGDELFLMARSSRGSLYFSLAKSSDAVAASGWSTPSHLPITHDGNVSGVDVGWDADGAISVAYSVAVNDARGVYLVQSTDRGVSWSEPLQLFDGAAADFDLVGSPAMLASADGFTHILWQRQSLLVEGVLQPLSLYYARSADGGRSFGEAEVAVETGVAWQEIAADGTGNLHRLWQQPALTTTVWDQVSFDRGQSWQVAQRLPAEWEAMGVTGDPAGRLHLVGYGLESLGHWLWDGSQWQAALPLRWPLAPAGEQAVERLAAAVNQAGELVVVLAMPAGAGGGAAELSFTHRTLDLPTPLTPAVGAVAPPASPTELPATPSPEPSVTPTAVESGVDNSPAAVEGPTSRLAAEAQYIVAFLPVTLLLLVVLGRVILRAVRVRAR